jgi:hypothetical protein
MQIHKGGHTVLQRYRVTVSFRGVNEYKKFVQIPPGAVLRVPREHEEGRLVAVQWRTEKLHVFLQDLQHCALPEQTLGSL